MIVELWLITAIISILFKTGYQSLQKELNKTYESLHLAQIAIAVALLLFIPYTFYQGVNANISYNLLLNILSGLMIAIGIWTLSKALDIADISLVSPLQQTIPIFVVILEPIILSRYSFNTTTFISALIVIFGVIITVSNPKYINRNLLSNLKHKGAILALISALTFGLSSILTHQVTQVFFVSNYLIIQGISCLIFLTIARRFKLPKITKLTSIYGILFGLTLIFDIITLSLVNASIATILFRGTIISNLAVGYFIFNEDNILIRSIGSLIIFIGILILVI